MRVLLVLLLCVTAALSGCESLSQPDGLLARSSEALKNQRQRLAELAASLTSDPEDKERHAEVQALFEQEYIDPLTLYLQRHAQDPDYATFTELVRAERSDRCGVVAARYATQEPNADTLQRLKRGYALSCPAVIDAFALRVANAQPKVATQVPATIPTTVTTPAAKPETGTNKDSTASQRPTSSSDAKNCYLLFSIKNFQQAQPPCSAAAAKSDGKAQHHLAVIAQTDGDRTGSLRWARESAKQGDANGQLLLAQLLSAQGEQQEAATWLQAASDQGQREANFLLAQAYQQGTGINRNFPQSQVHLHRAASAGYVPAILQLASQQKGSASARSWLTEAANRDSANAQYQLGMDYLQGTSGDIDLLEAYVWLSLALVNGENRGKQQVEQLSSQLSPEELTQAQSRIHSGLN